ncbi:M23 family metallopeptidase [Leucobacter coleopterorum]|uniref:M23 family metallopeptidase n=1 Tax=Leucobacter coleopterorum TaxID=2714933 RepID=A0ABX6JWS2_9MICO|nr:M23 family metallopeptidase [Leucobacter coleopterorum]
MKVAAWFAAVVLAIGPGVGLLGIASIATPPGTVACAGQPTTSNGDTTVATEKPSESASVVFPLPAGTWVRTDGFGPRDFAANQFHTGTDFAAADGTPILAAADGIVTVAEFSAMWGGLMVIEHTINGQTLATAYAHMWQNGIFVSPGQKVQAGQHIGAVGSSGLSTGAHLHFEVRPGGSFQPAVDAEPWLASLGAIDLGSPGGKPEADCTPAATESPTRTASAVGISSEGLL